MFAKGKEGDAGSISWPKPVSSVSRGHESVGSFNFSHLTRYADLIPGGRAALSGGITLTLWGVVTFVQTCKDTDAVWEDAVS